MKSALFAGVLFLGVITAYCKIIPSKDPHEICIQVFCFAAPCPPMCTCIEGYERNIAGKCVKFSCQDPNELAIPQKCFKKPCEEFNCVCRSGYVRDPESNACVQLSCSGPNEHYVAVSCFAAPCPPSYCGCDSGYQRNDNGECEKIVCNEGYQLDSATGQCVEIVCEDPNEVFTIILCKKEPCKPSGCDCKAGYHRDEETMKCVESPEEH